MKWLELFAQFLPAIFSVIPALRPHTQTAIDATKVIADAAALGPITSGAVKTTALTLTTDAIRAVNDELAAANQPTLDHELVTSAASSAIDTAIAVTNLVHASHGTGDAPATTTS